jgi:hypothetical protein
MKVKVVAHLDVRILGSHLANVSRGYPMPSGNCPKVHQILSAQFQEAITKPLAKKLINLPAVNTL